LTTIATNREELWGDLQYTNNTNGNKWKGKTKVFKFKANELTYPHCDFIVGFCGTASDVAEISSFFEYPEMFKKPPRGRGASGLVLTENRDIFLFDHYSSWLAVAEPFLAVGSGASYAIGAMAAGATPKEAVKIAMKSDCYTGMGTKGFRW
jgi:hypothetical protein